MCIRRVCACVHHAEAVRCYCNETACVSTGYICKSQIGLCFSQSTPGVATLVTHGCADSLSAHLLNACTEHLVNQQQQQQQQVITCCADDLCNYVTSRTGWMKCNTANLSRYTSSVIYSALVVI